MEFGYNKSVMVITVNGEEYPWTEGLTVETLLEEKKYSSPMKTVFINGKRVFEKEYAQTQIQAGDEVNVLHLMCGG